ncbi:hypothetical protein A3709_14305 [Halioglobus sp. HI00S01]|uniref:prepilin-type N-terminal cleavage/methylation domain-containing protein n=1 Tax=Halioglobus sp. HI00S01 TaxID=1822214 RepID=UPI0007C3B9D8|nr:prepilin-type N-terminal cleavage/methylation domain-containing protein [Halioglobus sp. HI00S01]KZX59463.1 hypothetical protein A3709_14305 [Halioglobus sp. HI00S01]
MGLPARRIDQRGFSLLELLVTLFVVVLVTSLVTLNVGSGAGDYELQGQMEEIADTAAYALDEAQFVGWDFGLLLLRSDEPDSAYSLDWLERGPERWRAPASGKDVFRPMDLPADITLELELDGVLQEQEVFLPTQEFPAPQMVFYASGETPPGNLSVIDDRNGELLWRLEWDLLGNFRALYRGEEPELQDL